MKPIRIAVAGIGGVGGYFGGKLAHHYQDSHEVEIYFISRGENEKAIRTKGLLVQTPKDYFTAYPKRVTSTPEEIGVMDYILCSPKSYDLDNMLKQITPCVGPETVVILVMNGVDIHDLARQSFANNPLWMACAYTVSRLESPGFVKVTSNVNKLFFGSPHIHTSPEQGELLKIMHAAGIDAREPSDIKEVVWEKFFYISPIATLTSYLDVNLGDILYDSDHYALLRELLVELKAVADAKHINLPDDVIEKTFKQMASVPSETTSSMHSDFKRGSHTEVDSLTGYVVREAKALDIPVPAYERMYEELTKREKETVGRL